MTKANWTAESKHKKDGAVVYVNFESVVSYISTLAMWEIYEGKISVNRNRRRVAGWEKGSKHHVLKFHARYYAPYNRVEMEMIQLNRRELRQFYSVDVTPPGTLNLAGIRELIANSAHQFLETHFVHA